MASKIFAAVLVVLIPVLVQCDPVEYYLDLFCGQSIYVSSAAILKVNNYWSSSSSNDCIVTIIGSHASNYNQVRLGVLSVTASCWASWLHFYDGQDTTTSMSTNLCSDNWSFQNNYLTTTSSLTIRLHSGGSYMSAKLLVTSTSTWFTSGDFVCDNLLDIAGFLKCDGYNNCGDWSDEHFCTTITWSTDIYIISGFLIFGFIFTVLVIILLVRRCRQRAILANTTTLTSGFAPPSYGTIYGGYVEENAAPRVYGIVTPPPQTQPGQMPTKSPSP